MLPRAPDDKKVNDTRWLLRRMMYSPGPGKRPDVQATDPNDVWAPNYTLGLLRGVTAGLGVPLAAMPFIQVEAKLSSYKQMPITTAIKATIKQPWKGYSLQAMTNVPRCTLYFMGMPYIKNFYEYQGLSESTAKTSGALTVAALEGWLMALRFIVMQQLHTTNTPNVMAAWRAMPREEMLTRWRYSRRYGIGRDMIFLPVYFKTVEVMEEQLLVAKQQETPAKWEEEFMIGATAGFFSSLFSFPIHAALRRQLVDVTVKQTQDVLRVWQEEYSQKPFAAWQFITRHVYRGFSAAAVIMPVTMGATNLAKHAADVLYAQYQQKTGLFRPRPPVKTGGSPEAESRFLLKMGSA